MSRIQVFDHLMCCSTGVCGPEVAPAPVRFAADLEWLEASGVEVERVDRARCVTPREGLCETAGRG